jgi:hypothetical protein
MNGGTPVSFETILDNLYIIYLTKYKKEILISIQSNVCNAIRSSAISWLSLHQEQRRIKHLNECIWEYGNPSFEYRNVILY